MVETFTRSTTARKLWALPGAYLNALRAPVFEDSVVKVTDASPIISMSCPSFLIELEHGHGLPAQGYCVDVAKGTQSARRLQMVRDAYDADVWIGHDVGDWASLPHAPEHIE